MKIEEISYDFSVCKVADYSGVDLDVEYCFVGKTDEEKSLVCITENVPTGVLERDDGWKAFRIQGVLDFSLIGILSRISVLLAENGIGIFAYWKSNFEVVKEMLSQAEIYVYENNAEVQGFIGLSDEYIEGIFVSDEMQSCGIGKLLLDYIKDKKVSLRLNVYQKNARAISFYQREGFIIQCEGLDEATGEKEYTMLWKRK